MRLRALLPAALALAAAHAAEAPFQLPPFPKADIVVQNGLPKEISSTRLLRELHKGGLTGFGSLETNDADYALLRRDTLGLLASWLEATCTAVGFNLPDSRRASYDGTVFGRLVSVGAALGRGSEETKLALPIGLAFCQRKEPWGAIPGDKATDAYILLATEGGMLVYDPPTRQFCPLAEFPNRKNITRIRF